MFGLFVDFPQVFDLVHHKFLLKKPRSSGIRGISLEQLTTYLTERFERVHVNRSGKSDMEHVSRSVPQGFVLGLLLYNICANVY